MTAVLLIADTERVQRVFADLESKGVLRLHAAATLAQVEQLPAAATPAYTFVQSRICGLSTAILLRHLKKTLPENAKIVFLSAHAADVPRKDAAVTTFVDLRLPDDVVAETVAGIVTGASPYPPKKGRKSAAGVEKRTNKGARPRKDDQPGKELSLSPRPAAVTVAASPAPCPPPVSFLELMEAASSRSGNEVTLNVKERASSDSGAEIMNDLVSPHTLAQASESAEDELPSQRAYPLPVEDRVNKETFLSGKRKRALWPFVLLLSFLLLPSAAYLLGRVARAPQEEARQYSLAPARKGPSQPAAPAPATAHLPSKAAIGTSLTISRKPDTAQLSGLTALPPFLEGVRLDRGYSAGHPGWERYLGAKAEYRIFREGGRYRAIQAIARADEIPQELVRRVLLEFGGIAGYAVKSTEAKGKFLVEQATGSGSASLTIYRKRGDRGIKGVVVYYH